MDPPSLEALMQASFIFVVGVAIILSNLLIIATYLNFRAHRLEKKVAQKRAAEAALPPPIPKKRKKNSRSIDEVNKFLDIQRRLSLLSHNLRPADVINKVVSEAPKPTGEVISNSEPPIRPNNFKEESKGEDETPPVKCHRPLTAEVSRAVAVAKVMAKRIRNLPKPMTNIPEGFIQLGSREHHIARQFPKQYRRCLKNNIPLSEMFPVRTTDD